MPYSKYSKKQKRLAAIAEPRDKITEADLKKTSKYKKKGSCQCQNKGECRCRKR